MTSKENLADKNVRRRLITRYLDAMTDPEEERALAEYFSGNVPDEDEKAFARLLAMSAADPASDEGAAEFDRIVSGRRHVRRVWLLPSLIAACAAVLLLIVLPPASHRNSAPGTDLSLGRDSDPAAGVPVETYASAEPEQKGISPVEMACCLDQVLALCGDDAASADARPSGSSALVTVNMKDGSSRKYFMTFDSGEGSASFVALDE